MELVATSFTSPSTTAFRPSSISSEMGRATMSGSNLSKAVLTLDLSLVRPWTVPRTSMLRSPMVMRFIAGEGRRMVFKGVEGWVMNVVRTGYGMAERWLTGSRN